MAASDAGKCIFVNAAATITVDDGALSEGDAVTIVNHHTAEIQITQDTGMNIYNTSSSALGSKKLASRGMATIWFCASDTAYISGAGLTDA